MSFTVPWARIQGRGRGCLFPFSQICRSLIIAHGICGLTKFQRYTHLPFLCPAWLAVEREAELGRTEVVGRRWVL